MFLGCCTHDCAQLCARNWLCRAHPDTQAHLLTEIPPLDGLTSLNSL
jgi:hypothetical protein